MRRLVPVIVVPLILSLNAHSLELETIPPDRPWLIFRAPEFGGGDALIYADQLKQFWQAMPEHFRGIASLEIDGPRASAAGWGERCRDVINELQFASVPAVITAASSPSTVTPVSELRDLFDRFTAIKGVHVAGLRFDEYPDFAADDPLGRPAQAVWLSAVIELAAQYGRRVIIELCGVEWIELMANTRSQCVYDAMRKYPAVVVPLNRLRGPDGVTGSSAAIGLWLEGAAGQWGLACDSRWHENARFIEPGKFGVKGNAAMPPALYRAMVLNGAMTGATVYRFPRTEDLWGQSQKQFWEEALDRTLREVLDGGFIARKDLVQEKTRVAYRLQPASRAEEFEANLDDLDPLFHDGRMMHGAYGLEMPGQVPELVLNTGQFFWVPVLSPYAGDDALQAYREVVLPGALLDASAWRERLLEHYQPDGDGTAFISRIGRGIFVMHTRENFYEEQTYALAAVPKAVREATGRRAAQTIDLTWPFREGDVFYRVYRRTLPSTEWELVSGDLDAHAFSDAAPVDGTKTVAYAITALTSETEALQGKVNYGDYLVINAVESRILEQLVFEPNTNATTSVPELPTVDARPASQPFWPGIEELEGEPLFAAQAIVAQLEAFELAFRSRDAKGMSAVYSGDYADAAGWGAEYVFAAYEFFFKQFRPGPVHHQIRAWDFSTLGAQEGVRLTMYYRLSGQRIGANPGRAAVTEFPASPTGEVTFTFAKPGEQWLIVKTDPPLPRLDDFFPSPPPSPTPAP